MNEKFIYSNLKVRIEFTTENDAIHHKKMWGGSVLTLNQRIFWYSLIFTFSEMQRDIATAIII